MEKELRRRSVTRLLLWEEYRAGQSRRLWLYVVLHDLRGLEEAVIPGPLSVSQLVSAVPAGIPTA